jgi:translation initiation factor IF-2
MENKELLALLKSRGYEVKSASSTVDNISADALREEFAAQAPLAQPVEPEPLTEAPVAPKLPEGAFVKSVADIEREHQQKSGAEKAEKATKTPESVDPAGSPRLATPPPAPNPASSTSTPPASPMPAGPPKPPATSKAADAEQAPVVEPTENEDTDAPTAEAGALKKIHVKPPIVVRDFAGEIGLKPFKLISELMEMGIFASMNQTIEESVAVQVAGRHGCELEIHHRGEQSEKGGSKPKVEKPDDDDPKFLKPRPPVVCILGHVDHGKTTLLDTIRKANVVKGEAGGITQHIGAYQIVHKGQKISFIDTPGHAAFSMMRERGANVTDVSILVIAADDAFKPQTEEALKFAKEANNSIIVAINKIDSKGANIDRVKQQMQEKGIAPEDWGGETIAVEVSALKGTNIDNLLDMIQLQVELLELKANPRLPCIWHYY